VLAERHRKLAKLFPKLKIPTADAEKGPEGGAGHSHRLRGQDSRLGAGRQAEIFPDVHRENVTLVQAESLGVEDVGIAIAAVASIVVSADGEPTCPASRSISRPTRHRSHQPAAALGLALRGDAFG
jgi:hypothetical protein